jgi:hypothetical protein
LTPQQLRSILSGDGGFVISKLSLFACIFLFPPSAGTDTQTKPPRDQMTFVQMTDAHIFDDGWKAQGADPFVQAMDDRAALHWAVEQINKITVDETAVDFVVYTGDFGLQNVVFSDSKCSGVAFKSEPGLPPFSSDIAASELALELNRLKVSHFYAVPGNNDIIDESVLDGVRFECFISQLRTSLQKLASQVDIQVLRSDTAIKFGRFRLAGLNTASFKNAAKNYDQLCQQSSSPVSLPLVLQRGCPLPQLNSLKNLVSSESSPLILFTHIPDLVDPYEKEKDPSRKLSTWDISPNTRRIWEDLASKSQIPGIFAGHFHSNNKTIYGNVGTTALFVNAGIGEKTWVAPPLAGKNQRDGKPQARGFLLANINESSGAWQVDVKPFWYLIAGTQKEANPMSPLSFFGLTVLVSVLTGCFGGTLNFLRKEPEDQLVPRALLSDLLWGIGAALLVPLFLHIIGSDLVTAMHNLAAPASGPDYSKVLVFGGFCLIAAMSAKKFISSISDRALRQVESAEKKADRAQQQASQVHAIVEHLVEPASVQASVEAVKSSTAYLSDEERRILAALANSTKYVLRTRNGVAIETEIGVPDVDKALKTLSSKKMVATADFESSDGQKKEYWYITAIGRTALTATMTEFNP